jgi:phosphoglycerate dehydrogenase-like enzyme
MTETVLVTDREYAKAEAVFRAPQPFAIEPAPAPEEGLAKMVAARSARAVIVGVERYCGPLYSALAAGSGRGALIARFGVGHDGIDKRLIAAHRILLTNTPGALDQSVAEYAICLLGALARRVTPSDRRLRAGRFEPQTGVELRGRTLGLLGFGAIAQRTATIAHFGFGMKVLAFDCRTANEREKEHGKRLGDWKHERGLELYTTDLEVVLRQADFVSVHLPLGSATRHFLNAARLAMMKPDAMLINTARGAIVDEVALYDALASGSLAGAAIDVFEAEPYAPVQPDKDLRQLENTVLTPHVASNTREANHRMAEACLANVAGFLAGRLDRLTLVSG